MQRFVKNPPDAAAAEPLTVAGGNSRLTNPLIAEYDRWFLWLAPLFGCGIALYFSLLEEPNWITSTAGVVIFATLRVAVRHTFIASALVTALLTVAAGFLIAKLRVEWVRAPVLATPLKAADVTGRIDRIELRNDQSSRLTVRVEHITGLAPEHTPNRIRIVVRKLEGSFAPGQPIRITARLAAPPGPARPNGFDFARAAYFQSVGAVGYALSQPQPIVIEQPAPVWLQAAASLEILRRHIGNRVQTALPGEVGVMANALMTGERSGISERTNEAYRDSGIFHILAISGLHMAIMGGSVFFAMRILFAAMPPIALRYPIKKWAAISAALAAFAYLLISGGAHATIRAFIMILIMFIAILIDRPAIALRNVALAAILILAVMPESLYNAGFQLSFAAVVGLVSAYEWHRMRRERLRRLGFVRTHLSGMARQLSLLWLFIVGTTATTVIAGLATAPMAAFHFHAVQQYSVLTNLLAIPVSNLIVMPAALAAFIAMPFSLEFYPLAIMGAGIQIMTWSAETIAGLQGAVAPIPAFHDTAFQLMIFGGLWLAIWRRAWRLLGIIPVCLGTYAAALTEKPAALIGKNGQLVAVRDAKGAFIAIQTRGADYEYSRWLASDGDTRTPKQAWHRTGNTARGTNDGNTPLTCDLDGCLAMIGTRRMAMPRSPAALIDDCRHSDVLVLTFPKPAGCRTTAIVLDFYRLRDHGTHAVFEDRSGNIRIETVEQFRGTRPWTIAQRLIERDQQAKRSATINARISTKDPSTQVPYRLQRSKISSENETEAHSNDTTDEMLSNLRTDEEDGYPLYWYR